MDVCVCVFVVRVGVEGWVGVYDFDALWWLVGALWRVWMVWGRIVWVATDGRTYLNRSLLAWPVCWNHYCVLC